MTRLLLIIVLNLTLSGCYYMQAASGQLEVLRKREPIDKVIADAKTSEELAARLALINEARDFSIDVLGLPDNKSYRSYADLERDYVIWNVLAAPEFSLEPKTWCYPVAGCVSYRGYFAREKAIKAAQKLRDAGMDVAVGGVAAYSTLGKFNDPLLSTMMQWDDVRLVAVLFHELAHQVVYVKGDTAFNESFATAVEEYGVKRWLESRGELQQMQHYLEERAIQQELMGLVAQARDDLGVLYASELATELKREQKRARLDSLADSIVSTLLARSRDASRWQSGELNNASLITWVLYEGELPKFRAMLAACENDIQCFYAAAKNAAQELQN